MNLNFIFICLIVVIIIIWYIYEQPRKSVEIYNSFPIENRNKINDIHVVPLHGTLSLDESQKIVDEKSLDILYYHGILTKSSHSSSTDGISFIIRNEGYCEPLSSNSNEKQWIFQLHGSQKLYLFAPEQTKFLYPTKVSEWISQSKIDIQNPDLDKYPLYLQANYIEIIIPANTAVWIPQDWWVAKIHQTQSISIQQNNSSNFGKILTRIRNAYKENLKISS
tara:strand:+ start:534 stop:1199 length:666 start_codon:yes stop_codon:yes gene_type:complete